MGQEWIITSSIFWIGSIGVYFTRKNLIVSIMSLEMMLMGINMNNVIAGQSTETLIGQISTLYVLVVGAAESAIGLSLIIVYYKSYKWNY